VGHKIEIKKLQISDPDMTYDLIACNLSSIKHKLNELNFKFIKFVSSL